MPPDRVEQWIGCKIDETRVDDLSRPFEPGDRFVRELVHFAAVIRGEEQPRMTGQDGLRAVEVIHAAYGNRLG